MTSLADPSPIDSFVADLSDAGTAPPDAAQQTQRVAIAEKQQPGVSAPGPLPRGPVGGDEDAHPDEGALDVTGPGGDPSLVEAVDPQLVDGEMPSSSIEVAAEASDLLPIDTDDVVPVSGAPLFTARPGPSAAQRVIVTATQDTAYASAGMSDDTMGVSW